MKAICIIRTSTDRQRIEEQTAEVVQMAINDGFTENDIEVIGECGASAIKLDDAYIQNLNKVYERIKSGDISCIYAWAIDRIGRNEVVLMQFKNELIKYKIQLKIKNPALTLFNENMTVNAGVELAFSLFATMSKQEMEQKKERFSRGKRQNGKAEKYNGGTVAFGYYINEIGKYMISEPEAHIIQKIYNMYASGKYSLKTLTDELKKRDIKWREDKPFTLPRVKLVLYNTCYIGQSRGAGIQKFPRIISDELYKEVHQILKENKTSQSQERLHNYFANKLIHCPECGYHFSANGRLYRCVKHSNNKAWSLGKSDFSPCHSDMCISIEAMDGLLY
ncbi:MAG: recombinase family protein, partial [Muribaculaceae bacterium]|nr:recombinase family protein [Muribaculaceae bacterium]